MQFFGSKLTCIRGNHLVFADLDFCLGPGNSLMLVGHNGSGKTSLLRMMAGLTKISSGRLEWDDGSITEDPNRHRQRINYIGHLDAVKSALTVHENLSSWARLRGVTDKKVDQVLILFGLDGISDVPGRYLSAGQKHRLSLARLGISNATLWLLDEPTVALDRESIDALYRSIADHRASGGMIVVATNVDLDIAYCRKLDISKFTANFPNDQTWG